jgi:hypothetical protein
LILVFALALSILSSLIALCSLVAFFGCASPAGSADGQAMNISASYLSLRSQRGESNGPFLISEIATWGPKDQESPRAF